ncbi:MAG: response regulator [Acidobacteria bacterium]|nr:response regulator [Acidobacteriota bacterium]
MASKILAVDDDPQVAKLTVLLLEGLGYEALGLTDPRRALEVVRSFRPEACIIDLNMPFVSGSELLDRIRAESPHTEIILLTGMDDTLVAVDFMKRGAADFLLKPISAEQLDVAVIRALEHRRLVLENTAYKQSLEALVEERSRALNEALRNLGELHEATIETLAQALDMRDQGSGGHSRRVADMTVGIARKLGIRDGQLVQIEQGALLHDIGKLRIPDSILWKPSALTPGEWATMRRHPEYGYDFVSRIGFLQGAADIVLSHHERYDGTGYPRGLKGDEISLGARIFSMVDTADAILYDRPYHRASDFSVARDEILRKAGTHFDPTLVRPTLEHLESCFADPARSQRGAQSTAPADADGGCMAGDKGQ